MGYGKFEISLVLLREVLCLPDTAKICSVTGSTEQQTIRRTVTITVEDLDLLEIGEGDLPRRIAPVYAKDEDGRSYLADWGIHD